MRAHNLLMKFLRFVVIALTLSLFLVILVSVFHRYFLNISLAWVEEFSRYMFVWGAFMAATLVFSETKDLKFEWLFEKCGIKARRLIEIITLVGVMIFMAVVLYQGMSYTARVFWIGTASIPIVPRESIYLILPLFSDHFRTGALEFSTDSKK
jgi:C4-dicarboxylate transporter DctQ subunit